ncbi:MAG TPA: hypothetical protein PKK94_12075, partial [Leptospiraceae bacterium]|nr:hypothetical protein [Leptospiraceae bacterium]
MDKLTANLQSVEVLYYMAVNLKFKDETMTGNVLRTWTVPVVYERATVAEIIGTRVEREVEKYNQSAEDYFNGLVQ